MTCVIPLPWYLCTFPLFSKSQASWFHPDISSIKSSLKSFQFWPLEMNMSPHVLYWQCICQVSALVLLTPGCGTLLASLSPPQSIVEKPSWCTLTLWTWQWVALLQLTPDGGDESSAGHHLMPESSRVKAKRIGLSHLIKTCLSMTFYTFLPLSIALIWLKKCMTRSRIYMVLGKEKAKAKSQRSGQENLG